MQIDTTRIAAEVYAENRDKHILYIKVSIPSLRIYINSCTVRPSPKFGDLWFQMPAFLVGSKWIKPIENEGSSEFIDLLKDEAMRAADRYIFDQKLEDVFPGATHIGGREVNDVTF